MGASRVTRRNVTAGKYNDGDTANRPVLANRMYQAMAATWKNTKKTPIKELAFRSVELKLEARTSAGFSEEEWREFEYLEVPVADAGALAKALREGAPLLFTADAPVPPESPEMRMMSARALATPAAIVPTPTSETSFTETIAFGFTFFRSKINCARSSIE